MSYQSGQVLYTRKMFECKVPLPGPYAADEPLRYEYIRQSDPVFCRKAAKDHSCFDCGNLIRKGEMHAGSVYGHYCFNCITPECPPRQIRKERP